MFAVFGDLTLIPVVEDRKKSNRAIGGGHYIDMCGFKNIDLLQPYLHQIDISKLCNF
jgi:hypothetical protein